MSKFWVCTVLPERWEDVRLALELDRSNWAASFVAEKVYQVVSEVRPRSDRTVCGLTQISARTAREAIDVLRELGDTVTTSEGWRRLTTGIAERIVPGSRLPRPDGRRGI